MNSYNKARPTSAPVLRTSKLTNTVLTSDKGDLEGPSEEKSQSKWQIQMNVSLPPLKNGQIL